MEAANNGEAEEVEVEEVDNLKVTAEVAEASRDCHHKWVNNNNNPGALILSVGCLPTCRVLGWEWVWLTPSVAPSVRLTEAHLGADEDVL